MIRRTLLALLATAAFCLFVEAGADTLIVNELDKSESTASERPSRGQTMDKVAAAFGQPSSKQSAVGDPPIARWEYANFVVYFEYQHVIHAVQKH